MAIGAPELILILVAVLLLFGPEKIPELMKGFGKALGEFNLAQKQVEISFLRDQTDLNSGKLRKMAKTIGVAVDGKSDSQILSEVNAHLSGSVPKTVDVSVTNPATGTQDADQEEDGVNDAEKVESDDTINGEDIVEGEPKGNELGDPKSEDDDVESLPETEKGSAVKDTADEKA